MRYLGDWVGEWNLGGLDALEVAATLTPGRTGELYVHNRDWFGVISGRDGIYLDRLHHRWIHDYRYGRNW